MGTGGVGGFFGAKLAAAGEDVTFIARGEQLKAIRLNGLRIQSEVSPLHVRPRSATDDPASVPVQDVILFCVKLWDVEAAAEQMRPMVGPETAIIALQNGVDSERRVAAVLGEKSVMGGVVHDAKLEDDLRRPLGNLKGLVPLCNSGFGTLANGVKGDEFH